MPVRSLDAGPDYIASCHPHVGDTTHPCMSLKPTGSPQNFHQSFLQCARPLWYADYEVGRLHGMTSTLKYAKPAILRDRAADGLRDVPAWLGVSPNEPSIAHPRALVIAMPTLCDHANAGDNSEHLQHSLRGCTTASSPFCSQANRARGRPRDRADLPHLLFWVVHGRTRRIKFGGCANGRFKPWPHPQSHNGDSKPALPRRASNPRSGLAGFAEASMTAASNGACIAITSRTACPEISRCAGVSGAGASVKAPVPCSPPAPRCEVRMSVTSGNVFG